MSRLFEIEPETPKPRKKPRKLMHVYDAGPAEDGQCMVVFLCGRCDHKTDWLLAKNVTEAKRGMPCPKCNKPELLIRYVK
jgi:DNA-directed RNA polymerase subunit RPC12/RpoP